MTELRDVVITEGVDGTLRLGSPAAAPAGTALVTLPGITLIVDPSRSSDVLHAVVYEPDAAATSVALLLGDAVADAVADGRQGSFLAEPTPALEEVHRLGILEWMADNRTVPLDEILLDLECAVARAALPDDGEDAPLDDPGRISSLATMARRLREDPSLPLCGDLLRLFRDALPSLPVTGNEPWDAALVHERELLRVEDVLGSTSLTPADIAWLATLVSPPAASHLGPSEALVGTASLDWGRVPRALLPSPDASVAFTVSADRVEVLVPAPTATFAHPALPRPVVQPPRVLAALRSSDWPLPLAEGVLEFDSGRRAWRGSWPIVPAAVDLARTASVLDVDVRAMGVPWSAPNRQRARVSAGYRWAARGWESRRLAAWASDPELDERGIGALHYAARHWAAAGDRDCAQRCSELAEAEMQHAKLTIAERWFLVSGATQP